MPCVRRAASPHAQALCKVASRLTSIRLAGCYNVGPIALAALGKGCPRLTDVNLAVCPRVNAAALASLTSGCSALTTLCLRGCDNVDDEGLQVGRAAVLLMALCFHPCVLLSSACVRAAPAVSALAARSAGTCVCGSIARKCV